MMSSNVGYMIVEIHASGAAGTTVVATKDFLPGEIVWEENEPLMFLPKSMLHQQYLPKDDNDKRLYFACFETFMKLDPTKQEKFLTLRHPAIGATENALRNHCKDFRYSLNDSTPPRLLTKTEVNLFVRVSVIMKMNVCAREDGNVIYSEFKRFGHSCSANCSFAPTHDGNGIRVRTTKHVTMGDELTVSYNPGRDSLPTHIRRQKYLEGKEFTCHCPRCDAPGDDTRQFDCFYTDCKGVIMVCQPLNNNRVSPNQQYSGVSYVEPHLLPCTKCHRAAPAAYQTKMLALEAKLPDLHERFAKACDDVASKFSSDAGPALVLLSEIESLNLPRRHQLVMPILHTVLVISCMIFTSVAKKSLSSDLEQSRGVVQGAAHTFLAAQEAVTHPAHETTALVLNSVCHACISEYQKQWNNPTCIFSPAQAKALLQRLLRLFLMCDGRDMRHADTEASLVKVLSELPPSSSTELCAFCEESPLRAAITLSRCGKCKQVCYCSAGCQKAHWKLHKKSCK